MAGTGALRVGMGTRSWTFHRGTAVSVGRGSDCDIVVDDPLLSRRHLRIEFRGGWIVEDPGSRNGSWVDGRRLRSTHRVDGLVVLRLGNRRSGPAITVELAEDGAVTPSSATLTIGRAPANDIVLNDDLVSRRHARIETTTTGVRRVVDLGSRNGTLVNGTVADPVLSLADGDRLTVGNTEFEVCGTELRPSTVALRRLVATGLGYEAPKKGRLVSDVEFDVGPGELIAVIGPSGAGKSTLLKLLTGQLQPSAGAVSYDGYNVHDQFDAVRLLIGLVPQEDVVHRRLTVRQALAFAAKLRLPDDLSRTERRATVDRVLGELGLTEHARTRIDRLSGGQRKRVSIALELLTSPSLLFLDEPTSGLDPALDRHVMKTLRGLADGGRAIVVVTHSVAYLDDCDRVLLLAPGGLSVYFGRPGGVLPHFGTADWADVFAQVMADPSGAQRGFAAPGRTRAAPSGVRVARTQTAGWATVLRQARTVAARHAILVAADPPYALFLVLLPVLLAALVLVVPGSSGLLTAGGDAPGEPGQILVLLVVGAAFAGGAVAAREVIGERMIVVRERSAGLRPEAYALAKLTVFGVVCAVQAVLLVVGCALVRPLPATGVLLGSGRAELAVALWLTALASCQFSLLASAVVRSAEQVMPVLVVGVMAQLVLCGGLVPVTGRPVVGQLSWLVPARWGYAATAATADLRHISPLTQPDGLWRHAPGPWLLSVAILGAATVGSTVFAALRVGRMDQPLRRQKQLS